MHYHYVLDILKQFGIGDCKHVATPLDVNSKLVKHTDEEYAEEAQLMLEAIQASSGVVDVCDDRNTAGRCVSD